MVGALALFEPAGEVEPEPRSKGKSEAPPRTSAPACKLEHFAKRRGALRRVRANLVEFAPAMAPGRVERWALAKGFTEWWVREDWP